jgi:hypothetical protein
LHRQATTSFRSGHDRWTITSCSLGAPVAVLGVPDNSAGHSSHVTLIVHFVRYRPAAVFQGKVKAKLHKQNGDHITEEGDVRLPDQFPARFWF